MTQPILGRLIGFASTISMVLLPSCAELTHYNHVRTMPLATTNAGRAVFLDAKQRAVFMRPDGVCAEPSPDALSALAVSQGGSISTKGTTSAESFSLAEAASSIGLRTQSIQLMRDHMYRLCEAFQNKAISALTFQLLHRRFQTEMVSILAIEQLTGTVRAPAVILGGSSSTGNADAVVKLTATREMAATSVAAAESELVTKQKLEVAANAEQAANQVKYDAATDATAKASAKTVLDDSTAKSNAATADRVAQQEVVSGRKTSIAAIDRALTTAQASGSASESGTIENIQSRGPADIAMVATAVEHIVKATMEQTNTSDFCTLLLSESVREKNDIDKDSAALQLCLSLLKDNNLKLNVQTR